MQLLPGDKCSIAAILIMIPAVVFIAVDLFTNFDLDTTNGQANTIVDIVFEALFAAVFWTIYRLHHGHKLTMAAINAHFATARAHNAVFNVPLPSLNYTTIGSPAPLLTLAQIQNNSQALLNAAQIRPRRDSLIGV
ncbi:hypothetical protein LTR56_025860 [Elasticomyces elasticus]|nr:hypothetical protein LTR56_025860 [Elasticomyces elasticus]KAK3620505.1 hypothetical protein LTR22_025567 [Elasticomyces elasticus]KAK4904067.1 hypothetical protein LTR49_026416 [Elasticomyces elasticus]KAK5768080.1 hypothetical protein LTS12_001564 [Elasticomyces elasticus]